MPDSPTVVPGFIRRPQGGGPQPVLTAEQVAEAVHLRNEQGWTIKDIAERFFVHHSTMARYLAGAGCTYRTPVHKRSTEKENMESLLQTLELSAQGYSARDIAALTGLHPTSVRQRLHKHARDRSWMNRPHRLADGPPG
jgi:predicted transcriptional regulator